MKADPRFWQKLALVPLTLNLALNIYWRSQAGSICALMFLVLIIWMLNSPTPQEAEVAKITTLREKGVYPQPGRETNDDVSRLYNLGQQVLAIKLYGQMHDVSFPQAKTEVERMVKAGK